VWRNLKNDRWNLKNDWLTVAHGCSVWAVTHTVARGLTGPVGCLYIYGETILHLGAFCVEAAPESLPWVDLTMFPPNVWVESHTRPWPLYCYRCHPALDFYRRHPRPQLQPPSPPPPRSGKLPPWIAIGGCWDPACGHLRFQSRAAAEVRHVATFNSNRRQPPPSRSLLHRHCFFGWPLFTAA
jgi:hypothetical protein